MDILEMTGIQLKNEFLLRNGFKHADFSKRKLVNLMSLIGEVQELSYSISTLNKATNEFQFGHSVSFKFNEDKTIESILLLDKANNVIKRIDYLDFKNSAISRITSFNSRGEKKEVSTFEYDKFFNRLKAETRGLHHQNITQFPFTKTVSKDHSEYVYGENNKRIYRNGKLIETNYSGDKQSEVMNYYYSEKGKLLRTECSTKTQFELKETTTFFNDLIEVLEIKSVTKNLENNEVRFYDQKFQYFDNGNIERHLILNNHESEYTTYYKYDSIGNLVEIWEFNAVGKHNQLAKLDYDYRYNLTELHYFQNGWKWNIFYKYDKLGNWVEREIVMHDGSKEIQERNIKYAVQH